MACPNCGEPGPCFVPPSFGEAGFYSCHRKDCAERAGGKCNCDLSRPIPYSRCPQEELHNTKPEHNGYKCKCWCHEVIDGD